VEKAEALVNKAVVAARILKEQERAETAVSPLNSGSESITFYTYLTLKQI